MIDDYLYFAKYDTIRFAKYIELLKNNWLEEIVQITIKRIKEEKNKKNNQFFLYHKIANFGLAPQNEKNTKDFSFIVGKERNGTYTWKVIFERHFDDKEELIDFLEKKGKYFVGSYLSVLRYEQLVRLNFKLDENIKNYK